MANSFLEIICIAVSRSVNTVSTERNALHRTNVDDETTVDRVKVC